MVGDGQGATMNEAKQAPHILALVALIVAFVILSSLYNALTPLGEGPDEPGHAAYVLFLARESRLPDQRSNEVPGEGHQPPLAYLLAAPAVLWLPPDERQIDMPGNSRFVWVGGDQPNAVGHGSREWWPWGGAVLGWHLIRLVGTLLGAATVAGTWLAGRVLERRYNARWLGVVAAALVAFNPQFLFTSALATNDTLLAALSAWLVWAMLVPRSRPWLVGLLLGLALITKQSALLLVPLVALAALLEAWETSPSWSDTVRSVALRLGAVTAIVALVAGWWYWRNWQLYGDPLGFGTFQVEFATQPFDPANPAAWSAALLQLWQSFWARFGWMNVAPPAWVPWLYAVLVVAGLAGLIRRMIWLRWPRFWLLPVLAAFALAWVVAFALAAGLVAWQGRLVFPALAALALVIAAGLTAWAEQIGHLRWLVPAATLALTVGLAAWLPFGVIAPAYPRYAVSAQQAQTQIGNVTYGRLGRPGERGAELLGWRLDGPIRPGAETQLTLVWHALARQNRNWTVFVHMVDSADEIVAKIDRQPTDGAYPMLQWVADDWIVDTQSLALPADLAPGTYDLRVGLFDAESGLRAAVFNQKDKLAGDYVTLGQITVEP